MHAAVENAAVSLDCGLRLRVLHNPTWQSFALALVFETGWGDDPEGATGCAALGYVAGTLALEQALGAPSPPGGDVAYTQTLAHRYMALGVGSHAAKQEPALRAVGELLRTGGRLMEVEPAARERLAEAIRGGVWSDTPRVQLQREVQAQLSGVPSYGRPWLRKSDDREVQWIPAELLASWQGVFMAPANAVLTVAGPLALEAVREAIESPLAGEPRAARPERGEERVPPVPRVLSRFLMDGAEPSIWVVHPIPGLEGRVGPRWLLEGLLVGALREALTVSTGSATPVRSVFDPMLVPVGPHLLLIAGFHGQTHRLGRQLGRVLDVLDGLPETLDRERLAATARDLRRRLDMSLDSPAGAVEVLAGPALGQPDRLVDLSDAIDRAEAGELAGVIAALADPARRCCVALGPVSGMLVRWRMKRLLRRRGARV
jgi:hypothetical protein